jgi:hypothetical protein
MGLFNLRSFQIPSTESIPSILGLAATAKDVSLFGEMLNDPDGWAKSLRLDRDLLEFSKSVASSKFILFEASSPSVQSIVNVIAVATPMGAGAAAGYIAGQSLGGGIWVIFTVPAGMILARVAVRVGTLIDKGIPLPNALWEVVVGVRRRQRGRRLR